jgi:hypothetical protein
MAVTRAHTNKVHPMSANSPMFGWPSDPSTYIKSWRSFAIFGWPLGSLAFLLFVKPWLRCEGCHGRFRWGDYILTYPQLSNGHFHEQCGREFRQREAAI